LRKNLALAINTPKTHTVRGKNYKYSYSTYKKRKSTKNTKVVKRLAIPAKYVYQVYKR
jgi:hypothetical protein